MPSITPHQKEALNFKEHISLTANAGSGKTFVLAKRYVEIALSEGVSLRNIVAITFTDKAAGELYKKISDEIDSQITTGPDKTKSKLEKIRRQLVSANISTIHAFCIDVLREFPIEAQLDANFTPIDQGMSDEMIELSVEEVIKSSIKDESKSGELKYLIRLFASKNVFASTLIYLIQKRKNILRLAETVYSKTEEEISDFFFEAFKKTVSEIISKEKVQIIKLISEINSAVLDEKKDNSIGLEIVPRLIAFGGENKIEDELKILSELKDRVLTKSGEVRKQGYLKNNRDFYSTPIKRIEKFFSETGQFAITEDHALVELELARTGKYLIGFFNQALGKYQEKKRQGGYLDFEDILLFTQKILLNEEVCKSLGEKFRYIMVDEYQDTNEVQYEIFMPILDNLRRGNLFIVGDEKQSIYMFRDAELKVFNKTKKDIADSAGEKSLLMLPDSFRMAPAICLFTNYLFRRLFISPNLAYNEVGYNDLVCAKEETTPGKIEIILSDQANAEGNEAEMVARRIIQLTKGENPADIEKLKLDEIAILCRKRKSFDEIEKIFYKYRIPFTIVGGKGFYQKQFVYDIHSYLSFLINKENDVALLAVLRSPFFTLSDVELFEISLMGKYCFLENLKAYASEQGKLQDVLNVLLENLSISPAYDLVSLIRKITGESNYIAVLASRPNGEQEVANLEKLIGIAANFTSLGYKTLYDFINYLKDAISKIDDEGQAAVTLENNSVKIMTLHQAKGLEFKAVFLYACQEYTQQDTVKTKSISINKDFGLLTTVPINGNYFDDYFSAPVVSLHNFLAKKKNLAEIKRLLYVGITRAKNYLFISATHKGFKFNNESFMRLVLEGLNAQMPADKIKINSKLSFLKVIDDTFSNVEREISMEIPVIQMVEKQELPEGKSEVLPGTKRILRLDEIVDSEQDEVISATKIAVFKQCPVKYQLNYELGYGKLLKYLGKPQEKFDHKDKDEDGTVNFASVKGKIIHSILEEDLSMEQAGEKIEEFISAGLDFHELTEKNIRMLKASVINDLNVFYNSQTYREIKSLTGQRNEFEIHTKADDYYLFGIIDKLIVQDKKATIIDFKSDDITEKEINQRQENYVPQLKFYALLVSRLFPEVEDFTLRLIFIKHPDKKVYFTLKRDDIPEIGREISQTVEKIRLKKFDKNKDHCKECYYSVNWRDCIKKE